MPPLTHLWAEEQVRGKTLELGGAFSREGDAPGTLIIHESTPGAKDAVFEHQGDMVIQGDLDVKGTLTSIESAVVEIADYNITLNFGGTDLSADGAGITIARATSPWPSIVWKNSKNAWVCGLLGSEQEITTQGNVFNGAGQLCQLDAEGKIPVSATRPFTHEQLVPSSSWVISHGMQKHPSVTVVTSAGDIVCGDVNYVDENNLVVNFAAPFGGTAYLN
jgi:hypothetical protein